MHTDKSVEEFSLNNTAIKDKNLSDSKEYLISSFEEGEKVITKFSMINYNSLGHVGMDNDASVFDFVYITNKNFYLMLCNYYGKLLKLKKVLTSEIEYIKLINKSKSDRVRIKIKFKDRSFYEGITTKDFKESIENVIESGVRVIEKNKINESWLTEIPLSFKLLIALIIVILFVILFLFLGSHIRIVKG